MLTELTLSAAPKPEPDQLTQVALRNAQANFSQQNYDVTTAVDGIIAPASNGWASSPKLGEDRIAVFETHPIIEHPAGTTLTFTLEQHYQDGQHSIGRFRILVTSAPQPITLDGLPEEITKLLAIPAAERNAEQQAALFNYYRAHDAQYQELKAAVARSQEQLAQQRLLGAQDIAWALINSPAFLFNH